MATALPSLPGRSDSNVLGVTPTVGRASRSCRDGLTGAGDDCPGLRNSVRGLREMAGGAGALGVDSTAFGAVSLILLRPSPVRSARVPLAGAGRGGVGATGGRRRGGEGLRGPPRRAGAGDFVFPPAP